MGFYRKRRKGREGGAKDDGSFWVKRNAESAEGGEEDAEGFGEGGGEKSSLVLGGEVS